MDILSTDLLLRQRQDPKTTGSYRGCPEDDTRCKIIDILIKYFKRNAYEFAYH